MKKFSLFLSFIMAAILFSCKPSVPSQYIQPGDFEDLIYDLHIADAMSVDENGETSPYSLTLNREAVMKKHGYTQEEFDSTLNYYVRHADRLHKIYENVSKRLSNEALALGASANDLKSYGDIKSSRDTSNLWNGVKSCLLAAEAPYNVTTFEIEADTSYHKGDRIIFSFNTDFIVNSGNKDATALLAIVLKNDSVIYNHTTISSNSMYRVVAEDRDKKGIKAIRGFIYLNGNKQKDIKNPIKIMSVYNIKLIRQRNHNQGVAPQKEQMGTTDSLRRPKDMMSTERGRLQQGISTGMPINKSQPENRRVITTERKTEPSHLPHVNREFRKPPKIDADGKISLQPPPHKLIPKERLQRAN